MSQNVFIIRAGSGRAASYIVNDSAQSISIFLIAASIRFIRKLRRKQKQKNIKEFYICWKEVVLFMKIT